MSWKINKEAAIAVFGCRHRKEFLARTDTAMHFVIQNNINPMFIFIGCDSPPPEEAISVFGADRIIWENASRVTQENVRNTLEEIRRRCWRLDELPVYFASSWYHIPRIKLFLKREGANLSKFGFIKSYNGIQFINVLVEPFAFLAAFFKINNRPFIVKIKRRLGYNV